VIAFAVLMTVALGDFGVPVAKSLSASGFHEFWLASGRTRDDSDESVARGIAHTGRIITAAALIMSISFAALMAATEAVMKLFGAC
jgi:uncharacterized membrane protein YdfJ with MMPL/SSD domain